MRHGMKGAGFGRRGGWQCADVPDATDATDWFAGRVPAEWFTGPPTVEVDREELLVVGELKVEGNPVSQATIEGQIARFREATRLDRMRIADEAEARYGRKTAWGVRAGETTTMFTQLAVPVMTRLRQPERQVLDTLVDAGVARSRSDALVWAVKLVGEHTDEWLASLREAMRTVDDLRSEGPKL
jgi:hypothetical protein